jgi:hypothetical protein
MESRRVAAVERGVRSHLEAIDTAASAGDFEKARQSLAAATGELRSAPALVNLKADVERIGRSLEERATRQEADRVALVRADATRRLALVEIEIERIGTLVNPIAAEGA